MSRPPATSRKLRRVLVLLALFLTCQPEPKTGALNSVRGVREQFRQATQTARALLGAGAVPFSRSVPAGIWARSLLVARRAEADGTLDGGEAEDNEEKRVCRQHMSFRVSPCLEASSAKYEVEEVEEATTQAKAGFDQAQWLQKTAEQIRQFGVDEVSSWVRAALETENYGDKGQSIAEILKQNDVRGTALLELTAEKMRTVGILMGPAEVLAKRIAAVSAPPTAASAFQAGGLNRAGSSHHGFRWFRAFRVRPESHRIPSSLSCPHTAFSVCSWRLQCTDDPA
ncbi:unnamed protein product [Symbiodinium sp. CCMP2592]|nr:unnamed protein product [Symbiodinium sp. CCMP2592]CAE7453342.1 unnamed protein product [Symbiodinium sp. CCMP2592]